jgi:hypothetical protein
VLYCASSTPLHVSFSVVSIFIAVSLQQQGYSYQQGNAALILSGAALAFIGIVPPVGRFFTMVGKLASVALQLLTRCIEYRRCCVDLVYTFDVWMD